MRQERLQTDSTEAVFSCLFPENRLSQFPENGGLYIALLLEDISQLAYLRNLRFIKHIIWQQKYGERVNIGPFPCRRGIKSLLDGFSPSSRAVEEDKLRSFPLKKFLRDGETLGGVGVTTFEIQSPRIFPGPSIMAEEVIVEILKGNKPVGLIFLTEGNFHIKEEVVKKVELKAQTVISQQVVI